MGTYFSIYYLALETGIQSDISNINEQIKYSAPLPNFGLVALFNLKKWLSLDANLGFFSLRTKDLEGTLYDFSGKLVFKPAKWFGINLSYQVFDIRVIFPFENVNTTVDYNFRGPAVGVNFDF